MTMRQAVVYGSNGGIGSAVTRKFLQNNFGLFLFSRNEEKLKENIDKLRQSSPNSLVDGCAVDVCDPASIESSVRYLQAVNRSPVDHLVVCAGVNQDRLLVKETDSNIEHIIQTNLISSLNICKQYAKLMLKQNQDSSIVLIGSVIALIGNPGQSTYASSKASLIGLVKSLSKELARRNVRVNLVMPGFVDTPMLDGLDKSALANGIPFGRIGRPEEIANAVYFLSTNRMMNAQMLVVDGGLSLVS